MKIPYVVGLVAVSVLLTIAVEESRIAGLRESYKREDKPVVVPRAADASVSNDVAAGPPRHARSGPEVKPAAAPHEPGAEDESFAKTVRKMWDNPAGKSMMSQGVKMAVAMMYQDFIDGLQLSKEEADYFKNLLGRDMAAQQELGMKMLGASPEEREAMAAELTRRSGENEEEVRKFLNSDEDFKSYTEYKKQLPERQQLDGIRSAMADKGVPLDAATESSLVDAMYRARIDAKAPDLSGPGAINEIAKGNMVATFEKSWETQQEALRAATGGILNETQMAAFQEYQKQAKEMQLMGLKMAEKMISNKQP